MTDTTLSQNVAATMAALQETFDHPDFVFRHQHDQDGVVAMAMLVNAIAVLDKIVNTRPLGADEQSMLMALWLYGIANNWSANFMNGLVSVDDPKDVGKAGALMTTILSALIIEAGDYYENEDSVESRQNLDTLKKLTGMFEQLMVLIRESDPNDATRYDRLHELIATL